MKRIWKRTRRFIGLAVLILGIAAAAYAQHQIDILAEKLSIAGLEVEGAELTAEFEGRRLVYSAVLPNSAAEVNVKVAAADPTANMTINNSPATEGKLHKVALEPGPNLIRIELSTPNGRFNRMYVLNATRLN
ncbi:MAG TPA: cadherin-like beta sandwich domain-containing protein [Symbiobacteriaceae bacterium]|nr:cadherin-like beta sandwich domain-containing protein [Symbiobacteriaceae bacterium]